MRRILVGALVALAIGGANAGAQAPQAQIPLTAITVEPSTAAAELTYFNRPILTLRARVLGREPGERAAIAQRVLDGLVSNGVTGPVEARTVEGGVLIAVGTHLVVGITPLDVNALAGETVDGTASLAITRLQQALGEAAEARNARALGQGALMAAIGLAVGWVLLWAIARLRQRVSRSLTAMAERSAARSGLADREALRASRLLDYQRGLVTAIALGLHLIVLYSVITFVLKAFPYTRPWGESLGGFLRTTIAHLTVGVVRSIPGLFTVFLIFVFTMVVVRLLSLWFNAIERGVLRPAWLHQEIARPTRRLVNTLLWLFAVVVSYPYLPGSNTDAFKGVSVFLGLMVTLGSSGFMNQIMSGFLVMYSRALKIGHFVKIGDVEGTVTSLGVLSTKIRTLVGEEVTVPNAVVVSQMTTDYSRLAETTGVLTPTSVTIGYDAPWRQVHALLLGAAERTPGLRRTPAPHVLQASLDDFYVRYTLYVSLDRQEDRLTTMNALYANIQDQFNEFGVQIMSPNYMLDPAAPKVVPKSQWHAAPAKGEKS